MRTSGSSDASWAPRSRGGSAWPFVKPFPLVRTGSRLPKPASPFASGASETSMLAGGRKVLCRRLSSLSLLHDLSARLCRFVTLKTMAGACQRCRQPLLLEDSLAALSPSAYDIISGEATPLYLAGTQLTRRSHSIPIRTTTSRCLHHSQPLPPSTLPSAPL